MKTSSILVLLACLAVSAALVPAFAADTPDAPDSISVAAPEKEQARLLEDLIAQLRQLRTDYYAQKALDDARLQKVRTNSETLLAEARQLRGQEAELDARLSEYASGIEQLRRELAPAIELRESLSTLARSFAVARKADIEAGPPFRQADRVAHAMAACADANDPSTDSAAERLAQVWSCTSEELRLARSSETYTARAPAVDGAAPYARYFRLGHLILGYVTEDDSRAGIWWTSPDGPAWQLFLEEERRGPLRRAVDIIDRRRAPAFVTLPVDMHRTDTAREAR